MMKLMLLDVSFGFFDIVGMLLASPVAIAIYVILGLFLIWLADSGRQKFKGQILCLYLMLYSLERFFVEGLRTDSLMIGPLRQAQVISLCLFAAGVVLYLYLRKPREGR